MSDQKVLGQVHWKTSWMDEVFDVVWLGEFPVKPSGYHILQLKSVTEPNNPAAHEVVSINHWTIKAPKKEGVVYALIKDHDMYDGMMGLLVGAGVINPTGRYIQSGHVMYPEAEILTWRIDNDATNES